MKIRVAAMLAAALAASLTACSGTASVPGPAAGAVIPLLRAGFPYTEPSLDETRNVEADLITGLGLETLLKFGPQQQLEPDLATSWAQASPVTYVYHLRHGVRFWDGRPLTAADVAYSLNYDRAPGSLVAFAFDHVKTIAATGPYTVTVTLDQPDAAWQYVPGEYTSYIFERRFAQAHEGTFGQPGTLVMGTGPWVIDSLDPTRGAQLSANPHWWGGTVPIQRISVTIFGSETSEALAFRAGEIDIAPDVSGPKSFASASGARLLAVPGCGNGFLGMNITQPGWNDVHVRRAVAYALNRADIIAAYGGYASPVATLTPPQLLRSVASQPQVDALLRSLPTYPYDLSRARQEMAASAYPHGFTATMLTYTLGTVPDVTQVIAAELAKIGIRLQIKDLPVNAWQAVELGPTAGRMTTFATAGCYQPDPGTYSDLLGSKNTQPGGRNFAVYSPAAVDTLLAQGAATIDPEQRFAIYSRLFARLQTDVPYVGLFVSDTTAALSGKFTYTDFSPWIRYLPWALNIKRAA